MLDLELILLEPFLQIINFDEFIKITKIYNLL